MELLWKRNSPTTKQTTTIKLTIWKGGWLWISKCCGNESCTKRSKELEWNSKVGKGGWSKWTNVVALKFAHKEASNKDRICIWERGVDVINKCCGSEIWAKRSKTQRSNWRFGQRVECHWANVVELGKWVGVNEQTLCMRDLCKTNSTQTIKCTIAGGWWADVVEFKFAENDANTNDLIDNLEIAGGVA